MQVGRHSLRALQVTRVLKDRLAGLRVLLDTYALQRAWRRCSALLVFFVLLVPLCKRRARLETSAWQDQAPRPRVLWVPIVQARRRLFNVRRVSCALHFRRLRQSATFPTRTALQAAVPAYLVLLGHIA